MRCCNFTFGPTHQSQIHPFLSIFFFFLFCPEGKLRFRRALVSPSQKGDPSCSETSLQPRISGTGGEFLEHAEVHGNLYGTSFQAIQAGDRRPADREVENRRRRGGGVPDGGGGFALG